MRFRRTWGFRNQVTKHQSSQSEDYWTERSVNDIRKQPIGYSANIGIEIQSNRCTLGSQTSLEQNGRCLWVSLTLSQCQKWTINFQLWNWVSVYGKKLTSRLCWVYFRISFMSDSRIFLRLRVSNKNNRWKRKVVYNPT